MFVTSLPYGVGTLAVGTAGVVTALSASSTAVLVTGIALGILGSYGFYGVISCALTSRNPGDFKKNIWKHLTTAAGIGVANTLQFIIKAVVSQLVRSFFHQRPGARF